MTPTEAPDAAAPNPTEPQGGQSADGSVADPATAATATAVTRRMIKRYSNRKLYDTRQSRYVTLLQIAEMVREGEDVQIIDNASKEDKTDITLALIISEELKTKPRAIPLSTLRALIRNRGERFLTQLRDSPIGRLMPAESKYAPVCTAPVAGAASTDSVTAGGRAPTFTEACDPAANAISGAGPGAIRRTLDQWQHSVDDRIRGILPQFSNVGELHQEIERLTDRVSILEQLLREASNSANGPHDGSHNGSHNGE